MMGGYYGVGSVWMLLMPLLWIALLGAVIWAVIRLTQGPGRGLESGSASHETASHESKPRETPLEILDRRFASGEIDAAAYDEARARLSGRGGGGGPRGGGGGPTPCWVSRGGG